MITRDMETVVILGRLALIVTLISTTSFPVLYWFSPWYRSRLGQAIMLQATTLMLAVWLKAGLTFFLVDGPRTPLLWANLIVLLLISTASTTLTFLQWNFLRKNKPKELTHEPNEPSDSSLDQSSAK